MNDDYENLGFSHDNPYYAALREHHAPARTSPSKAAKDFITKLMSPKSSARDSKFSNHCYAIVNWRDAASLLFEGQSPNDRNVAIQRLRAKTTGLDKLTILQQLEALPEFSICNIGPDYKSGSCELPNVGRIQSFPSAKELLAYLPRGAPCLIFDVTSIDTNTTFDIYGDRPQRTRIAQRSSAITELVTEIGELPMECLHDLKGSSLTFVPPKDLPLEVQALQFLTAALNNYHTWMMQKRLFNAD